MHLLELSLIDLIIIGVPLLVFLFIGVLSARQSSKNAKEYFLSGQKMPWWLLGISMVATTFAADTPNLVTDIVRKNGVAGNWVWWIFLLTGMLTVFVYARLWRRAGLLTDLSFYELRYGGKNAAFLRGFRALYLGFFFNVIVMAGVSLAAIKIMNIILGWSPLFTLVLSGVVTLFYSTIGGLRSIIWTDLIQFLLAMVGTVWAAYAILNMDAVGGLEALVNHPAIQSKSNFIPDTSSQLWTLLLLPLAIQWWSVWYPGAEPGGGGYVAQRMLAAKNENHALFATFLFNIMHYAVRPWPWIIIAFASLIVFPELSDIQQAFPHVDASVVNDDLAYPAMLTYLPHGLLGLVLLGLISAYMSTISTHLNWGASYLAVDFYGRFIKQGAEKSEEVLVGRIASVLLLLVSSLIALFLESALDAFQLILQIGAGTGLVFILRWFWWRINAWAEIAAMVISFFVALAFQFLPIFDNWGSDIKLVSGVLITTLGWLLVCFVTPRESDETLRRFLNTVKPLKLGWRPIILKLGLEYKNQDSLGKSIGSFIIGSISIYFLLFGIGFLLFGGIYSGAILLLLGALGLSFLFYWNWK